MQKGEVMTDRELLELAAKAAEINLQWMGGPVEVRDGIITAWNPLFDDGDALRLAARLQLTIEQLTHSVWASPPDTDLRPVREKCDSSTRVNVTRRAIVRAAAEIGKQMNTG